MQSLAACAVIYLAGGRRLHEISIRSPGKWNLDKTLGVRLRTHIEDYFLKAIVHRKTFDVNF